MADQIGPVAIPPTEGDNTPDADPLRTKLGAYLQSYVNALLSKEWAKIAPGQLSVIANVVLADTKRAWFDDSRLPTLFLYRSKLRRRRQADELYEYVSRVDALWVPPPANPELQQQRDPFQTRVGQLIEHALTIGRHPYWVDTDDDDPTAAAQGSVLVSRLGLSQQPAVLETDYEPNIVITFAGGEKRFYPAILCMIEVVEYAVFDPASRNSTAVQGTLSTTQGGAGDDDDFKVQRQY